MTAIALHPKACRFHSLFVALVASLFMFGLAGPAAAAFQYKGPTRGIGVLLGDSDCRQALELARKTQLLVYLQFEDGKEVDKARQIADQAGFYGTRIFVEKGPLTKLHLGDNLADAIVDLRKNSQFPQAEALRVLHPQATAWLGANALTKPAPNGLDDWSHPYHLPDNNPASQDQIARAPYLTQFLADPRYAPLPQVAVASAGRVFKAFGHIAFKEREEPWLNTLAAFNGYNGALLWRREIAPAIMTHRNTLIATPTQVFFGDDKSCKVFDAATGELKAAIAPPPEVAGGTFWKWMGLEKGVLYALLGDQEERDPVLRYKSKNHGWPWDPLSPGYNQPEHTWGFGRTVLALDPATQKVLWTYQENEPIDSRALCLKNGRLYAFRFGAYLTCLDAQTGRAIWRKTKENAPELFQAMGSYLKRQDWRTNWRTTAYLRCSDQALYFSGPCMDKLLAVSAENGRVLWEYPYNNYQLILQDNALYGFSGQIDKEPSRKFDPLTGKVLGEFNIGRRACSRPTAACDAIFFRAGEGSTRFDLASNQAQLVSPMRAQCQDGVTIANGLVYWWPSVCDCNLTLYGITCLAPAGNFDFSQAAVEAQRLESAEKSSVASLPESDADWPAFRANNTGTATSRADIPEKIRQLWEYKWPATPQPDLTLNPQPSTLNFPATTATAAGKFVFLSGTDGSVRALDAARGKIAWTAYTGGAIRFPPTIAKGRAFVGSGDGWVYAFEAQSGRLLWRFRAAPVERRIPIYGQLLSTWPAASGVLAEGDTVYAAAGLANYDGTHVYALDAATGSIRWQNNSSGHLDAASRTGVGVQGGMLLVKGKLYLAGGNAVSPAIYDASTGKCLNELNALGQITRGNNVIGSTSPRGWELYLLGNEVKVTGKPFYAHPQYGVYDGTVLQKTFVASAGERQVAWINNTKLACYTRSADDSYQPYLRNWGKLNIAGLTPVWERACAESQALALANNAVVLATRAELQAFALADGKPLWTQSLPAPPVPWGLALNRDGRIIVTLEDGRVVCFGRN